jgi:hypothetical protein
MSVGGGKAELHRGEAATATHGRTECKAGSREDCSCSHDEIARGDSPAQEEPQESSAGGVPEDGSEQEVSYSVVSRRRCLPCISSNRGHDKLLVPLVPSHICTILVLFVVVVSSM